MQSVEILAILISIIFIAADLVDGKKIVHFFSLYRLSDINSNALERIYVEFFQTGSQSPLPAHHTLHRSRHANDQFHSLFLIFSR
jgi:hypothetical protein